MVRRRMMKHLAEIAHLEILPAHWTMLEMLCLRFNRPVVALASTSRAFAVGQISHFRSRNTLAASV
ncbi:hypothetical protein, partial [Mesorhizobium sp.]|uniref:hypothetical protein n=1 Tax=Mesorhizobium sp. TaxID=1871066 RepID=UPI00257E7FCD